jgi:hypothetical protein
MLSVDLAQVYARNDKNRVYVRTDKNGTKIYHDYTCPRCGGAGGSQAWIYTGWTCYECGGTGRSDKPEIIKVYTPEYRAKLDAINEKRRATVRAKKAEAFKANLPEYWKEKGFNEAGKLYVAVGNTYEIKDQLREAGGKWNQYPFNSWIFTEEPKEFKTVELTAEECLEFHYEDGWLDWKYDLNVRDLVQSKCPQDPESVSEYVGEIGSRVELELTFEKRRTYEKPSYTGWGVETVAVNSFKDADGNVLVWKSSSAWFNAPEGSKVIVRGTISEHSEYNGVKQTILKRCKVKVA